MEWSGVEWSGVRWGGVEWSGVDWTGVEWDGVEWSSVGRKAGRVAWGGVGPKPTVSFWVAELLHPTCTGQQFMVTSHVQQRHLASSKCV